MVVLEKGTWSIGEGLLSLVFNEWFYFQSPVTTKQ